MSCCGSFGLNRRPFPEEFLRQNTLLVVVVVFFLMASFCFSVVIKKNHRKSRRVFGMGMTLTLQDVGVGRKKRTVLGVKIKQPRMKKVTSFWPVARSMWTRCFSFFLGRGLYVLLEAMIYGRQLGYFIHLSCIFWVLCVGSKGPG